MPERGIFCFKENMPKERLGTLQEIVFDHPDRKTGCAQVQAPTGREYYVGFAQIIPVEEEAVALIGDESRMGRPNFHIVKVPPVLATILLSYLK